MQSTTTYWQTTTIHPISGLNHLESTGSLLFDVINQLGSTTETSNTQWYVSRMVHHLSCEIDTELPIIQRLLQYGWLLLNHKIPPTDELLETSVNFT